MAVRPAPSPWTPVARLLRVALALGVALLLTSCITGERPTLGEEVDVGGAKGTPTGNEAVDEVLARLEQEVSGPFTARYRVVRKLGSLETDAVVASDGTARSVTVGDVRYLWADGERTCSAADGACIEGIDDARTSDWSIGSSFYAESPARRLRIALVRRAGEPVASSQAVAGVPADCVSVPLGPGAEVYCASEAGPLARLDGADLLIELVSFTEGEPDPALLRPA